MVSIKQMTCCTSQKIGESEEMMVGKGAIYQEARTGSAHQETRVSCELMMKAGV